MKRIALILAVALATLTGLALALGFGPFGRAEAATFHVDFDHGRDSNDGLSPRSAWKHAPGDPNATDAPARTSLRAGDRVVFAAKVRYRGAIVVTAKGTAAEPIVFAGATPGGEAIIDGSDPVTAVEPCRNPVECGGAADWRKLVRIVPPEKLGPDDALFSSAGALRPAQSPDPKDDFYRDEVDDMADVDGRAVSQGRVTLPHDIAAGLGRGARLALWVKPNRVVYRPVLSLDGDVARFDASGLQPYDEGKAAAIDHVSLIDRAGEFAVLPDGGAIVAMLPPGASVSVASGRGGFELRGAQHIVIRDLTFENMSDAGRLAPAGVAVFSQRAGAADISIENNRFRNFVMPRGQGPIILRNIDTLRIAGNEIDTISLGSGMRLTGQRMVIEDNRIRRIGRTGIMLMGASDVTVQRNTITDVQGVHGNGMSAYLDNHGVRFLANTVTGARQPATFHGAGAKGTGPNDILFANNLFVATPGALGALISWGNNTQGVTIRNNVLLGGKTGLRLSSEDTNVVISDNIVSGLVVGGDQPPGWRVAGNAWTRLSFQQRGGAKVSTAATAAAERAEQGQVSAELCAVVGRHSLPPDPAAKPAEGAVGATLKCP